MEFYNSRTFSLPIAYNLLCPFPQAHSFTYIENRRWSCTLLLFPNFGHSTLSLSLALEIQSLGIHTFSKFPFPRDHRDCAIDESADNWTTRKRIEIGRQISFLSRQEQQPVVYFIAIGRGTISAAGRMEAKRWLNLLPTIVPDN